MNFKETLQQYGIEPDYYLSLAKQKAKANKLNHRSLTFSTNPKKKLQIIDPKTGKLVQFGANGYKDYILYRLLLDPKAEQHRRNYILRASEARGGWIFNEYSPAMLSLNVLW